MSAGHGSGVVSAHSGKSKSNFWADFFLGGVSGAIAKTVSAPLERVKLLLQTQDSNEKLRNNKYKGFVDCSVRVLREEGVLAFWKGNMANIIRYFPTTAFNFAFKDSINRRFNNYDPKLQPREFMLASVLAGGLAGMGSTLFVYPLDFARTRMGVDVGKKGATQFNGLLHCLTSICRSDGIRGVYQGVGISLFSIFCYRGLYFGLWDIGKTYIKDYEKRPLWLKFLVAQVITTGSETINYPLDTVRRRLMMNAGLEVPIYRNTWVCIKDIYQKEGVNGYFKGCMSNAIRSLSSSLVLVLYDEFSSVYIKNKK